jgi:membrane protein
MRSRLRERTRRRRRGSTVARKIPDTVYTARIHAFNARMARLTEVPAALRHTGVFSFIKRLIKEIVGDDVLTSAAAMAYSWIFAIFPFAIFLLAIVPLIPGLSHERVMAEVSKIAYDSLPKGSADTVYLHMEQLLKKPSAKILSLGLIVTLWAASGGMVATMTALDRCYDINKPRAFYKQRGIALLMTICTGLLILFVALLVPVSSQIIEWIRVQTEFGNVVDGVTGLLINIGRYGLGLVLLTAAVSLVYQFGPTVRRRWTFITPGAVVAVLGVVIISLGLRWYMNTLGQSSYENTYGAIGGVVVLLLAFFLYATAFLIGAEVNSEIDFIVVGMRSPTDEDIDNGKPLSKGDRDALRFRRSLERHRGERIAKEFGRKHEHERS